MTENSEMISHSLNTTTRLDENLDQIRGILEEKGVTLESAMQTLQELRRDDSEVAI